MIGCNQTSYSIYVWDEKKYNKLLLCKIDIYESYSPILRSIYKKFISDDSIVVDIRLNKKFVACVINMGNKTYECQGTAIDQY